VHFPATPWRREEVVTFETAGMVLCRRFPGWTRRGDCLYQLATPHQLATRDGSAAT
jgi:hypothetical protein